MSYAVEKVDRDWLDKNGEGVFVNVFGAYRPGSLDRSQFALVAFANAKPMTYVTCIEMDSETLYWQYGGALERAKNTLHVFPACMATVSKCFESYKRISMRIENTNARMLKLAMKVGFLIVGTWQFGGKTYLELLMEKQ